MSLEDKKIIEATKFYLNKLISENDSSFIIEALERSNFIISKEEDIYKVRVKYESQYSRKETIIVNSTFSPNRIEINTEEKNNNFFNDCDIRDGSYFKERYALYELNGDEVDLKYTQSYTYRLTDNKGNVTNINPVNIEDNLKLEFKSGEKNLLTNYNNLRIKEKNKVLIK